MDFKLYKFGNRHLFVHENGLIKNEKNETIKQHKSKNGYARISIRVNQKVHCLYVHRIVAETFIKNKNNKNEVNHIDGNKVNNHIDNLEWVTGKENMIHAIDNKLLKAQKGKSHYRAKSIKMVDKHTNEVLKVFNTIKEAELELGIKHSHISYCCQGKRKTAGGFKWRYA